MSASICFSKLMATKLNTHHFRSFYSGATFLSNVKMSKTMQKLMNKANRKKDTKWYTPPYSQTVTAEDVYSGKAMKPKKRFSDGMLRRARHISSVMHEAVAQIVGTGELGIQISVLKVEVLPDMSHMNIYWQTCGDREKDRETQEVLDAKAKVLRHILIHSHTMGNVPRPVFVKDQTAARELEVEALLRKISMEQEIKDTSEEDEVLGSPESDDSLTEIYKASVPRETSDTVKDMVHRLKGDGSRTETHQDDVSKEMTLADNLEISSVEHCVKHNMDSDGTDHIENKLEDTCSEQISEKFAESKANEQTEIFEFRQDLYGVSHDILMKKVLEAKKTAKQRPVFTSEGKSQGQELTRYSTIGKMKLFKPKLEKQKNRREILEEMESQVYIEKENEKYLRKMMVDSALNKEESLENDDFDEEQYYSFHKIPEEEDDSKDR